MSGAFNFNLNPLKTYATRENAVKVVEKKYGVADCAGGTDLHYIICTHTDGRFFPVFIGERAVRRGVHFNFNVVA